MHEDIKNKQLRRLMRLEQEYDDDGKPIPISADELVDSHNPANDLYVQMSKHLQQRMVVAARQLRPSHLAIAKLAQAGHPIKDIAAQVKLVPQSVRNILKTPMVVELNDTMQKYHALQAGMTKAMRDAMCYRIALRNEISDPKVALAAIQELNKLDHNDRQHALNQKQGGQRTQTVVVQLADPRLKQTSLDDAPKHLMVKDVN